MTIEEIKEMIRSQGYLSEKELDFRKRVEELKTQAVNQALASNSTYLDPNWNQQQSTGINNPFPQPAPNPTYYDYEQFKKTRIPTRDASKDYQEAMSSLSNYMNKTQKAPVQALLDDLFVEDEKLDYLLSMGYRQLENSSYLVKGEPDPEFKRTFTLDEAFVIEMRVKLKNILLAKQSLKFKI